VLPAAICLSLSLLGPLLVAPNNVAHSPYDAGLTLSSYGAGTTRPSYDAGTLRPSYDARTLRSSYDARTLRSSYDVRDSTASYDARGAQAAYDGRRGVAAYERHPCAEATERCDGTVEVPLNWSDPNSERIAVAFAWLPRTDRSRPATGTILANPGGPAEALSTVSLFEETLGPVLQRQNLLVIDPRGLGKSAALICPDLDLNKMETVGECAAFLGDRAQFFTADQAAADFDAVREALGVPKLTFYGNSYGTAYAQAFVTRYPQRVAAVFLDSVIYTDEDGYGTGWGMESPIRNGLRALDDVCEPSRACRALPRRAPDRWTELVRLLQRRPDPRIDWLPLVQINAFTADAVLGRESNAAAAAYLRGDRAPLHRLVDALRVAFPPDDGELKIPEFAGTLAYVCAESAFPFDRNASVAVRRRQLDAFYVDALRPYAAEDILATFGGGGWNEWCMRWPTPRPSPLVPPNAVYPDVPVLVVDGQLDTTTPPAGARAVAERFPRATFIEIPFGEHASAFGLWGPYSECVRDLMRRFLTSYDVADPGCSAQNYIALGKFPRSVRDVSPAIGAGLRGSDRRVVAAAFSTALDALARRNPYADLMAALSDEPGLRGGRIRFDDTDGKVILTGVRYVGDLAVTGEITLAGGRAHADLRTAGRHLRLTWHPFRAETTTPVTGTLDGRPFRTRIPTT
jgi:pimeloyl-ACP methyl ester carboxylesterase